MHPPLVIYGMLFGLALGSALLTGYAMAPAQKRNWLHAIGFALAVSIVVYVIIDIEFPRLGLIRVDAIDQAIVNVRESMR